MATDNYHFRWLSIRALSTCVGLLNDDSASPAFEILMDGSAEYARARIKSVSTHCVTLISEMF